jgi:TusA-related sulfurtransferase
MTKVVRNKSTDSRFPSIAKSDLPTGRAGKHRDIVHTLLDDLSKLPSGRALKIPISDLPDTKENIRSALSRATQKLGIEIVTSSDNDHIYVWKS